MADLIVTSSKQVNHPGTVMTLDEFLEKASQSEDGINIEGDLYFDVNELSADRYALIKPQIPIPIKLFTINGFVPSEYKGIDVELWGGPEIAKEEEQIQEFAEQLVEKPTVKADEPDIDDSFEETPEIKSEEAERISSLFNASSDVKEVEGEVDNKEAKIFLFGSSKGGTGKTFTCMISAYRYARIHPSDKIAICDFDIIDGQIAITVHKVQPTLFQFYSKWKMGKTEFKDMVDYKVKYASFPENVDFYLAPKDLYIQNNDFWETVAANLISNYDVVFFDTGIDYLNLEPISMIYKIADKILLISTTSIKSVSSVSKQIMRLKGEIVNPTFSEEDKLADKIKIVITQTSKKDQMNSLVFNTLSNKAPIIGVFGIITAEIQSAEYFGEWSIFDKNQKFNEVLDKICEL